MAFRKKLVLYVAHALTYRQIIKQQTEKVEKEYYIRFVNPFYNVPRVEIEKLDSLKTAEEKETYKQNWTDEDCRAIVEMDLSMIDSCDGIVAFLTRGVLGTAFEVQYARTTNKKIYVITEVYMNHPWVRTYADGVFKNIDEFKQWLDTHGYKRAKAKE